LDAPVVFYYDFNSPYAYLAAERIGDLLPDAEWRPIAFAILLSKLGRLERALEQLDPAPVVAEVAQRAGDRGLPPFAPPEGWPVETWSLVPWRAALVADERGRLRELSRAACRERDSRSGRGCFWDRPTRFELRRWPCGSAGTKSPWLV
jgi:2-hydroxychromene-2-carboxylate isomerase